MIHGVAKSRTRLSDRIEPNSLNLLSGIKPFIQGLKENRLKMKIGRPEAAFAGRETQMGETLSVEAGVR